MKKKIGKPSKRKNILRKIINYASKDDESTNELIFICSIWNTSSTIDTHTFKNEQQLYRKSFYHSE